MVVLRQVVHREQVGSVQKMVRVEMAARLLFPAHRQFMPGVGLAALAQVVAQVVVERVDQREELIWVAAQVG